MKDPTKVLFLSQEIYPYLDEESDLRLINRRLPQACQENGIETRTFMPKFGEINERRNQLHEVIRLSGINIAINGVDHPLLLKVASIQQARIQIYFIDNDDLFHRRRGIADENGKEYSDNDERSIFYVRSSLETVQRLRWAPNIIQCSGWMSALAALFLRTSFADSPFFSNAKIIVALDDKPFKNTFPVAFGRKLLIRGVKQEHVQELIDKKVSYYRLMKLAIDNADAITMLTPTTNKKVLEYAVQSGKPMLPYTDGNTDEYINFYKQLLGE
ncbi:MAG: glycogen/starch synthase [Paludibacteraceae bacterium]|nr:glycogen/starch synthase [Paludibacteraceae bacterium]